MKENKINIIADDELFAFLSEKTKKQNKKSRCEALCDLFERQKLSSLIEGEKFLKGSIQEFATAWNWDRGTVIRFLEGLQNLNIIVIETAGNRKAFALQQLKVNSQQQ